MFRLVIKGKQITKKMNSSLQYTHIPKVNNKTKIITKTTLDFSFHKFIKLCTMMIIK